MPGVVASRTPGPGSIRPPSPASMVTPGGTGPPVPPKTILRGGGSVAAYPPRTNVDGVGDGETDRAEGTSDRGAYRARLGSREHRVAGERMHRTQGRGRGQRRAQDGADGRDGDDFIRGLD